MRYKVFGKTGLELSAISVGTWIMGGRNWGGNDRADSIAAIHAMLDKGVNHIDTAPVYGRGLSEEIVGEAVAGIRDKVIITTKCGMNIDVPYEDPAIKIASRAEVIKGCEDSLRRLKTDYIDFMLLHWPDDGTPVQETMEALGELIKQGKIRFAGVCNLDIPRMEEAKKHVYLAAAQLPYSMVDRRFEAEIKWCHDNDIATMTYGSLGAGILTGAIRQHTVFGEGDVRGGFYPFFNEPVFSKVMELVKAMDTIADNRAVPVAQVAINWAAQREYVHTALIGVKNREEAAANCQAMEWELADDEIMFLDEEIISHMG